MKVLFWLFCLSAVVLAQNSYISDTPTSKLVVHIQDRVVLGEYMVAFDLYNKFAIDEVEGVPSYSVYFSHFGVDASGTLHIQKSVSSAYDSEQDTVENFFVDINDMPILLSTGAGPASHPDVEVVVQKANKGSVEVNFVNAVDFEPYNGE